MLLVGSKALTTELGALEAIFSSAEHVIAAATPLFVQVRRGPLTLDVLDAMQARVPALRARFLVPGMRVAFVGVVEERAPVAGGEVRARQRVIIESMMEGVDARLMGLVIGEGVSSMLQRSVARGLFFANPHVRVAKTPEEAAAWFAPHLGCARAQIVSAIQRARDLR